MFQIDILKLIFFSKELHKNLRQRLQKEHNNNKEATKAQSSNKKIYNRHLILSFVIVKIELQLLYVYLTVAQGVFYMSLHESNGLLFSCLRSFLVTQIVLMLYLCYKKIYLYCVLISAENILCTKKELLTFFTVAQKRFQSSSNNVYMFNEICFAI